MGAGGGYSTELMARAVAPNGVVYGQNAPGPRRPRQGKLRGAHQDSGDEERRRALRKFDDPLPADVKDLDLITFFFAYHDISYMEVDRPTMNKKLFAALKPGGFLVIADHSAKPGDGVSVAKVVHRIEESTLRSEIEAAGFKLVAEGDFLRHPEDTRDFNVNRPTGPVDEFVLKFQKPM